MATSALALYCLIYFIILFHHYDSNLRDSTDVAVVEMSTND